MRVQRSAHRTIRPWSVIGILAKRNVEARQRNCPGEEHAFEHRDACPYPKTRNRPSSVTNTPRSSCVAPLACATPDRRRRDCITGDRCRIRGGDTMKKVFVLSPFLVALFALPAVADDTLVKFRGGIGVLPVAAGEGQAATADVVTRNVVRGVEPAGQIWVISALKADVKVDGGIRVDGRGLLLGGGDQIGFNGNANVLATL